MTRVVLVTLALVTAVLAQTTLFPHLTLAGFRPDLMVLVTVAFAMRDGAGTGLRVGFAAGLLSDLLVNHSAIGLSALVFVGIGYAVGLARPYLAPESVTAPLIAAFLSGVVAAAGYGLFSRLLGDETYDLVFVVQASLIVGLYNTLLAPIVFGLVTRLSATFPLETASPSR